MPVAGLVLTFSDNRDMMRDTLAAIGTNEAFTIGDPPVPGRVPLVMESDDHETARRQMNWLSQLPGVIDLSVVSVDNSDLDASRSDDPPAQNPADDHKGVASS